MNRLFRADGLDERLASDGYVITPFLDAAEVEELVAAYRSLAPADDDGLVIDFVREDRSVLAQVAALLESTWARHLDEVFVDHEIVVATFVTKHPGPTSAMDLHEEPSFVDERRARSRALWIPLVDTGPELGNGHLEVLPGSDRLPAGMAGYRTPVQFRPYADVLRERMVGLSVPAGHAAVYDSRTLHASGPNLSGRPRPAIAAALAPRGEPLVHVVPTGRRHRRIHRVDRDFFVRHVPAEVAQRFPDGYPVVDELDDDSVVTPDDIARLIGSETPPTPVPILPEDLRDPPPTARFEHTSHEVAPGLGDLDLDPSGWGAVATTVCLGATSSGVAVRPLERPRDEELLRRVLGLDALVDGAERVDVLALDEQGRAVVQPAGAERVRLIVIDCPTVNAGLRDEGASLQLDAGFEVALPATSATIWNGGPGPLHALLLADRPAAPAGRGWRGALGRLRDHALARRSPGARSIEPR